MKVNLAIYYYTYPMLMLLMTVLFARALYLAGRVATELQDDAVWLRRLLVVGLGCVGMGYLALTLITEQYYADLRQLADAESMKLGVGLVLIGIVFSFDLLVLAVWKRGVKLRQARASELI
jgi:hypothetical protein